MLQVKSRIITKVMNDQQDRCNCGAEGGEQKTKLTERKSGTRVRNQEKNRKMAALIMNNDYTKTCK